MLREQWRGAWTEPPDQLDGITEIQFLREIWAGWTDLLIVVVLCLLTLCACEGLVPKDTASLIVPRFQRSEIFGFLAGLGTTFAAVPDLVGMLRRRSSAGMNPRMAAIMCVFQVLWVYYGLLIGSRPVIAWNVIAVVMNFLSVAAYRHFRLREEARWER